MWALPVVGDLSNGLTGATYVAVAADKQGNVFVAGPIRGQGDFAGLKIGVAGGEGTFLAKLDAGGKGLWTQMITGNLYERQLAVDPDGNVILTGRYTLRLDGPGFTLQAVDTGACAVCKFSASGVAQWVRNFQRGDSVSGSVDIYNVAADASGIYVTGAYNQSIRFGAFTEKLPAPPFRDVGWLGKLNHLGEPQWLRPIGGSLTTDISLGANSIWVVGFSDPPNSQVLHGYRPDGSAIVQITQVAFSAGGALARGVGVDSTERPIIGGHAGGFATVGSVTLGIGQNPKILWGAAANPSGVIGPDAMMTGFLTEPAGNDLFVSQFEASPSGDLYYSGNWTGTLGINAKSYPSAVRKIFVAKVAGIPQPTIPTFVQQPQSQVFALAENRTLSCIAKGGGLSFQWFKNGVPVAEPNLQIAIYVGPRPGETVSQITFIGVSAANAGDYTCRASNSLGSVTSDVAKIDVTGAPVVPPKGLELGSPEIVSGKLRFAVPTEVGKTYGIEFKPELNAQAWSSVQRLTGNGSSQAVDLGVTGPSGFYRVTETTSLGR